jgi:hypothetical protein
MAKPAELMNKFAEECDSFIASSIFDPSTGQGIVDKSIIEGFDNSIPNAYFSETIKENDKALKALKANTKTIDYLITTNAMYLLVRAIEGTKYFQGCAIQKSGNLGLTRELLKKYESLFAAELKKL